MSAERRRIARLTRKIISFERLLELLLWIFVYKDFSFQGEETNNAFVIQMENVQIFHCFIRWKFVFKGECFIFITGRMKATIVIIFVLLATASPTGEWSVESRPSLHSHAEYLTHLVTLSLFTSIVSSKKECNQPLNALSRKLMDSQRAQRALIRKLLSMTIVNVVNVLRGLC